MHCLWWTVHMTDRPVLLVWSPAGPVLTVSLGPLFLSQWKSSVFPCTHPHKSSSKEQPAVDRPGTQQGHYDLIQIMFSSPIWAMQVVGLISNICNTPITILLHSFIPQMMGINTFTITVTYTYIIITLPYCLNSKLLWIKASTKWANVTVINL